MFPHLFCFSVDCAVPAGRKALPFRQGRYMSPLKEGCLSMSRYYYRQRKKAIRVAEAIARIKARDEEISAALKEVLANKERYLSEENLYLSELPHCECVTILGNAFFPVGVMLECWEHCPEFTLPDGFKIIKWCGGLAVSSGLGYNPETGEIRDYRYDPRFPNWRILRDVSKPYREKASGQ